LKSKVLYIHSGGDIIGGIESSLINSINKHNRIESYLGIIRCGKLFAEIQSTGFKKIYDLKGGRSRNILKNLVALFNAIRLIKSQKINALIACGTHSWLFGGVISKLANISSIFYVRNDINPRSQWNLFELIAYRIKPDLYIANSEYTASTVVNNLHAKNVFVCYPSANLKVFDDVDEITARSSLYRRFNITNQHFIFSCVGRIQPWKGQHVAIKAFNNFKFKDKSYLLIVGEHTFHSDKKYLNSLKELSGDNPRIIFTGHINDIPTIMKGSDVILHTSIKPEPFGNVVNEAMMAKKPIVATNAGGPSELINDGIDGILIEPGNHQELAEIMEMLIKNDKLRDMLSENAYKKSVEELNLDKYIERFESIIINNLNT
jgi:glycosyltransferase involved in cell wall biosynthesis